MFGEFVFYDYFVYLCNILTISMARLFQYKCKSCGYTVAANPKGKDILMSGVEIDCPVPDKCPECGGEMEKTEIVFFAD